MTVFGGIRANVRDEVRSGIDAQVLAGQEFPRTAVDLARIVGATPSHIFRHDQESGNSVDDVAGAILAPQGGITVGVLTEFGDADRAVRAADNTGQRMESGSSLMFNEITGSFAWLHIVNFGGTPPAATRNWIGKIGTAFYTGRVNSAQISFVASDGVNTAMANMTLNVFTNTFRCFIGGVNRAATEIVLAEDGGTVVATSLGSVGSLSNGSLFSIGRSSVSAPQTATYTARFGGAQAEFVLDDPVAVISALFRGAP